MDEVAGTMLGRYQVIKYLASGGMAQVLLARSSGIEGFERHVVIKRIHRDRARDDQAVKMFLDEARLAASLHHTNIVQVHDIGQENGEYFFAMEYIHGEDLRHLLTKVASRREKIPLAHVVSIVSAAASALHYAHDHRGLGIVHRDVSPANVIVGYDGTVKVVDFGIAKAAFRSTETQSGTLKGKISYMAPEQCMGQAVDRRSDVFALGIVLYELATVRRLFKGTSDFLTMSQIVAGNIPPPTTHAPDLPPAIEAVIMKALALSPADRYQSADEMRVALDACGLRSSTADLADYMRKIFGHRVEPWLADDDPEISVAVDFDGEATGVAAGPDRHFTPPPGSLLARARRKVAAPGGVPVMTIPTAPVVAAPVAGKRTGASTGSVTPMAWATPTMPSASKRRWPLFAALGAVLAIGGGVALTQLGGGTDSSAATASESAPAEQPVPAPTPAAEPVEVARPSAPEPTAPTEPATETAPATASTEAATEAAAELEATEQQATEPQARRVEAEVAAATPQRAAKKPTRKKTAAKAKKTGKKKTTGAKSDTRTWDPTKLLPD